MFTALINVKVLGYKPKIYTFSSYAVDKHYFIDKFMTLSISRKRFKRQKTVVQRLGRICIKINQVPSYLQAPWAQALALVLGLAWGCRR